MRWRGDDVDDGDDDHHHDNDRIPKASESLLRAPESLRGNV